MSWFIMVSIASRLMLVGPFTEGECRVTKQLMFPDAKAICVEREMIDAKRST